MVIFVSLELIIQLPVTLRCEFDINSWVVFSICRADFGFQDKYCYSNYRENKVPKVFLESVARQDPWYAKDLVWFMVI